jgi:hypothetical protein
MNRVSPHIRRFLLISVCVQTPTSLSPLLLDSSAVIARHHHLFQCTAVVIAAERQEGFLFLPTNIMTLTSRSLLPPTVLFCKIPASQV